MVMLMEWNGKTSPAQEEATEVVLSDSTTITVTIDSCKNIAIVNSITIVDRANIFVPALECRLQVLVCKIHI